MGLISDITNAIDKLQDAAFETNEERMRAQYQNAADDLVDALRLVQSAHEALQGLFDCDALEMYRRDDNPAWDAPEVAKARKVLDKLKEGA